jgi:hypothetical protein
MRTLLLVCSAALLLSSQASAGEVFAQYPTPGGGINASAWVTPDGSDSDMYAWDGFILSETQTITEVTWQGGYKYNGQYGKAVDFRISFFDSIPGGSSPVITALPEHESQETVIATFHTNGNAGEWPAGVSGGVSMYTYKYTLKTPVTLQGGVKYWFRVVASQPSPYPDWGMATGGTGSHFKYNQGAHMFQNWPHDLAFTLNALWSNLGGGIAGVQGVPMLSANATSVTLSGARPSTPVWFVGGVSTVNLPLASGILIPNPQVIYALNTNPAGKFTLPFVKPASMPAGVNVYAQAWIYDPAATESFSASNGISG